MYMGSQPSIAVDLGDICADLGHRTPSQPGDEPCQVFQVQLVRSYVKFVFSLD
jgi:hypothetical protein